MANAFYIQEEWITNYKLSGNDLLIFARLASFTLNVGGYNGSIEWLGHSVGITRRTAVDCVARLEEQGLIERNKKITKCVFQPLASGAKIAQKCAKIAQSKKADFAQNSANSAQKKADFAPKYYKENNYTIKCSDSVIDSEPTHTATPTLDFLFQFFKSKIQNEMDESCIRNLRKNSQTSSKRNYLQNSARNEKQISTLACFANCTMRYLTELANGMRRADREKRKNSPNNRHNHNRRCSHNKKCPKLAQNLPKFTIKTVGAHKLTTA
jgi:DNA-binding MarR family transcriptional regulator